MQLTVIKYCTMFIIGVETINGIHYLCKWRQLTVYTIYVSGYN